MDKHLFTANSVVVQQFLPMISSGMAQLNINKEVDKVPHLTKVLSLLLNPYVTELNCKLFNRISSYSLLFNNFLLRHTLKNCPNISKIELSTHRERPTPFRVNTELDQEILPVELFKKSWNNLKSIKSQNDYHCNEDTLKFILENFPNIESVIWFSRRVLSNSSLNIPQGIKHIRD